VRGLKRPVWNGKACLRRLSYPQPHCTVCLIPKRFGTDRATRKGRGVESALADLVLFQKRFEPPRKK